MRETVNPKRYEFPDAGVFYVANSREAYGPDLLAAMREPDGKIEVLQRTQETRTEFIERARGQFTAS